MPRGFSILLFIAIVTVRAVPAFALEEGEVAEPEASQEVEVNNPDVQPQQTYPLSIEGVTDGKELFAIKMEVVQKLSTNTRVIEKRIKRGDLAFLVHTDSPQDELIQILQNFQRPGRRYRVENRGQDGIFMVSN